MKIGYPPWLYGNTNRTGTSCLTLMTNNQLHAAFVDTSCNEVKSFICEKCKSFLYLFEFVLCFSILECQNGGFLDTVPEHFL